MEDILLRLLITILVGAVGAFLFLKMKIPAGAMIGRNHFRFNLSDPVRYCLLSEVH